jgi:hypothetical protein
MAELHVLARIPSTGVRSLIWEGDSLVDWVAGGSRFLLDGTIVPRSVSYSYRFDAACGSPSGKYAVIYERLGTKGLLLREGKIVREIDRSFYHAHVYEFPVCVGQLKSGREVLTHCPGAYNRIEIDDAETGERLTTDESREPRDFFQSRLSVHSNGNLLLSAGWIWHPFDAVNVYRLDDAVEDPKSLDGGGIVPDYPTEISSATISGDGCLATTTSDECFDDDEYGEDDLRPNCITVLSIESAKVISQTELSEPAGTIMAVDSDIVVGFHEHPKLVELTTGTVVGRMKDLNSGKQLSSIIHHLDPIAPLALDPAHRRFAIATKSEVVVVEVTV